MAAICPPLWEGHSVHSGSCCFPQLVKTTPQVRFVQQPVESAKPVPLVLLCFPCYGPQGGWPGVFRRSYGPGFLCRLRCHVDPLTRIGPYWQELLRATMSQSDSRLTFCHGFLSLRQLTRLALVVSAAGVDRMSQVPDCSLLTCHALRPRQAKPSLTCGGLACVGFRLRELRPRLRVSPVSGLYCFSRVRVLLAACELPCVRFQEVVRSRDFPRLWPLSFLLATLGFGRLVRPFHSFLSF